MTDPLIKIIKNTYKKIRRKSIIRYNVKRIGPVIERKLAHLAVSLKYKNSFLGFLFEEISDKIRTATVEEKFLLCEGLSRMII